MFLKVPVTNKRTSSYPGKPGSDVDCWGFDLVVNRSRSGQARIVDQISLAGTGNPKKSQPNKQHDLNLGEISLTLCHSGQAQV